ncbi:hypothetical protein GCM10010836_50070 [Aminobacter aminovorans]
MPGSGAETFGYISAVRRLQSIASLAYQFYELQKDMELTISKVRDQREAVASGRLVAGGNSL